MLNVKDFGAAGDGVTDDTAAVQAAFDAANAQGVGVIFPIPGDYLITSPVTVRGRLAGIVRNLTARLKSEKN